MIGIRQNLMIVLCALCMSLGVAAEEEGEKDCLEVAEDKLSGWNNPSAAELANEYAPCYLSNFIKTGEVWDNLPTTADDALPGDAKEGEFNQIDGLYRVNIQYGNNVRVIPDNSGDSVSFLTWSLKGSAPISEADKKGQVPTLNALANAKTIKASVSWSSASINKSLFAGLGDAKLWRDAVMAKLFSGEANLECKKDVLMNTGEINESSNFNHMSEDEINGKINTMIADSTLRGQLHRDYTLSKKCIPDEIDKLGLIESERTAALSVADKSWDTWRWQFGASAEIGQEDFSYLDATSFKQMETRKTPYAFGFSASYIKTTKVDGRAITANINWQRTFEEMKEKQICRNKTDADTCATGKFAPPVAKNRYIAKLEWKQQTPFKVVGGENMAFTLSASYDIDKDIFGVELPIFLYPSGKNLGGGIKIGWRSDTDDLEAGFFVDKRFSLGANQKRKP